MREFKLGFIFSLFFLVILTGCTNKDNSSNISIPDIEESKVVLFYGDGCPHCEDLDEFIEENDINDKVNFLHLEVWNDKDNQKLLVDRAAKCGLDTGRIGVPFLWDGESCLVGEPDIEEFFEEKASDSVGS